MPIIPSLEQRSYARKLWESDGLNSAWCLDKQGKKNYTKNHTVKTILAEINLLMANERNSALHNSIVDISFGGCKGSIGLCHICNPESDRSHAVHLRGTGPVASSVTLTYWKLLFRKGSPYFQNDNTNFTSTGSPSLTLCVLLHSSQPSLRTPFLLL